MFFPHYFIKFSLLFSTIHTNTHQLLLAALPCERVSRAGCPFITSLQGFSPQSRRLPHTRKAHPAARSELNARARSSSTPKIFDGVLTKENSPPPLRRSLAHTPQQIHQFRHLVAEERCVVAEFSSLLFLGRFSFPPGFSFPPFFRPVTDNTHTRTHPTGKTHLRLQRSCSA